MFIRTTGRSNNGGEIYYILTQIMNTPTHQPQLKHVSQSNNDALSVDYAFDSADVKYYNYNTNPFEKIALASIMLTGIGVPMFVGGYLANPLQFYWLWLLALCCWTAGLILGAIGIAKRKSITHNQLQLSSISVCLSAFLISALVILITVFAIAYGAGHL
jgi:hypothetical protein